jgi:uncharacterized GH25 family protein
MKYSLLALLAFTPAAFGHFIYLLPTSNPGKVQVVLSDALEVDEAIDGNKMGTTKLTVRGADGKEAAVTTEKAAHHLDATVPGEGNRLLFGTTDYGILQRGTAPAMYLKYHPKLVIGTLPTEKLGAPSLPIEIVPVIEGSKITFRVLVGGKPAEKVEVSIMAPGDKKEKLTTDDKGETKALEGAGRYAAWARFNEKTAGEANGKKYEEIRHYGTLVVDVK